jgi:hypothetical protein
MMRWRAGLDDRPRRIVIIRRVAFWVIVIGFVLAGLAGLLLPYNGVHHHSLAGPAVLLAVALVILLPAGAVFGWTNTKSARWRERRQRMRTPIP